MLRFLVFGLSACFLSRAGVADAPVAAPLHGLIVVGAGGEDEFQKAFEGWAERWEKAFPATAKLTVVRQEREADGEVAPAHRQRILQWVEEQRQTPEAERWLVYVGHGTYQQNIANLNLVGPDLSSDDLGKAIGAAGGKWRIFLCASSSAPFIHALSGPDRIVVTATKSGAEQNFSRFGEFLSQSITSPTADLDHDGSTSILEAFIDASARLANWYTDEGRLASEQALIDDNGDQRGTPAVFFRGVRAVKAPADGLSVDGQAANQVALLRSEQSMVLDAAQVEAASRLEKEIESLRSKKAELPEDEYYKKLETLLVQLARILLVR